MWNSQKIKERKKRYHKISYKSLSSIVCEFYFGTLVLALHCYRGNNVKQVLLSKPNTCFKENNNMTVEKISKQRQTFIKKSAFQNHMK